MTNLEKKVQREEWEKLNRLAEEVYKVPSEFREAKKKEFWEAMKLYNLKYKTKYNRFEKP